MSETKRGPFGNRPRRATPTTCPRYGKYGRCHRPRRHVGTQHATLVGGGSDPVSDPAVWFVWGKGVKPGYRVANLGEGMSPAAVKAAEVAAIEAAVDRLMHTVPVTADGYATVEECVAAVRGDA